MRPKAVLITIAATAAGALTILVLPPARAAIVDAMSCAQSTPCLEWDNTGGGDAVKGVSTKGNALHGQTKFKSAGKPSGKAGVFGEDVSTSGNLDSGVLGSSTNGAGVTGMSAAYNGVQGFSSSVGSGVYGQSSSAPGFGVAGRNTSSTHDNNGAGVLADGGSSDDGLHAFGNGANANGVYAFSQTGSALALNNGSTDENPELSLSDTGHVLNDAISVQGTNGNIFYLKNSGTAAFSGELLTGSLSTGALNASSLQSGAITNSGELVDNSATNGVALYATTPNGNAAALYSFDNTAYPTVYVQGSEGSNGQEQGILEVGSPVEGLMSVTTFGNLYLYHGLIYTGGSCHSGCIQGGKRVRSVSAYTPSEAEPTIEDTGESTLVNGVAHVQLDPKFANVIDTNSDYVVLITPEGDCRGLYVADRLQNGFVVRELQGGRASVGFAYRIVAKRIGASAPRLPMMDIRPVALPPKALPPRHPSKGVN